MNDKEKVARWWQKLACWLSVPNAHAKITGKSLVRPWRSSELMAPSCTGFRFDSL